MKSIKNILKILSDKGFGIVCIMGLLTFAMTFYIVLNSNTASTANTVNSPKVPVIMYHSILDNSKRVSKYVITPKTLEDDLKYIKKNGYTTVFTSDLIEFVKSGKPLPEKPIILTFDDGYHNNYSYAYPLLKKYGMKAVLSVVGTYSESFSRDGEVLNNNYSHITWEEIKDSNKEGIFEISNHSYDMHDLSHRKGILRKKDEDFDHYRETLINDITRLQTTLKEKTGIIPYVYTYPFGAVNNESKQIVKELGFDATYGCQEGINIISNSDSLYDLKRFNRSGKYSTSAFFSQIDKHR